MSINKKRLPLQKTALIGLASVLLVAGLVFLGYTILSNKDDSSLSSSPDSSEDAEDIINLDPPTAEDIQRAEDNKDRIVERENATPPTTPPANGKKNVTPVITYAGQYGAVVEVGGYTDGVFESSATCTATFTKSSHSLVKTVNAVQNTNAMDCPVMLANTSEFVEKGTWSVTISYNSATASGISASKQFEVK